MVERPFRRPDIDSTISDHVDLLLFSLFATCPSLLRHIVYKTVIRGKTQRPKYPMIGCKCHSKAFMSYLISTSYHLTFDAITNHAFLRGTLSIYGKQKCNHGHMDKYNSTSNISKTRLYFRCLIYGDVMIATPLLLYSCPESTHS